MNLETIRKLYKPQILALAEKYGVTNVRVFGSVARQDNNENSDIDFLVKASPETSLMKLGGLFMDLSDLLKTKIDLLTDDEIKPRLKEQILKDAQDL